LQGQDEKQNQKRLVKHFGPDIQDQKEKLKSSSTPMLKHENRPTSGNPTALTARANSGYNKHATKQDYNFGDFIRSEVSPIAPSG
jgi:hypothetical protein